MSMSRTIMIYYELKTFLKRKRYKIYACYLCVWFMLVICAYDLAHDQSIQFMLVISASQSRHLKGMMFTYTNIK